eukprot:gene21214-biopygen2640
MGLVPQPVERARSGGAEGAQRPLKKRPFFSPFGAVRALWAFPPTPPTGPRYRTPPNPLRGNATRGRFFGAGGSRSAFFSHKGRLTP